MKDCLFGRRELPSLESVEEAAARRLISNLLCRKPEDRWSAQRALNHAFFKCAEDTTQRARGMQQVYIFDEARVFDMFTGQFPIEANT